MLTRDPGLIPARAVAPELSLGDPLLDRYLAFLAARCRRNTLLATHSDLRVFFAVVAKPPLVVEPADVCGFITEQRRRDGDRRVVRLSDDESGLAARTIKRRLASVSGCSTTW